ncbi:uncharacterized protein, partial [Amphiura filiformis]|uniref:uncharacterized protein n=1 Tax=Amphiura filiformis TaxID=82378 RepID=UPI003B223E8B
ISRIGLKSPSTTSASSPSGFDFKFDLSSWSPENPSGLNLLGIQPQGFGTDYTELTPQQAHTVGKIKRPKSRLYCRRGAVVLQKNPLGRDVQGERKLRQAALKGDYDEVQRLLDSGVNPTRADDKGRTALHFATTKGNQQMVKLLLDNGADVNQKDSIGNTPLHLAAVGSHIDVVTALLQSGANAHELDRGGHTPLKLAHSRLTHLKQDGQLTSIQLKGEVIQLISMLRIYMTNMGQEDHMQRLDQLNDHLQRNSTVMDDATVDQFQDVLDSFTNMTIYTGI